MRIGLLRLKYDAYGGAERTLALLANELLVRGHEVHILTSAWQGQAPPDLNLHILPVAARGVRRLKKYALAAIRESKILALDASLSLERVPGCSVYRAGDGCHASWLARRSPYESGFKRWSFRYNPLHRTLLDLEQRTLGSANLKAVIANSHLVAQDLQSFYQIAAERITVIYNGVDENALRPYMGSQARAEARIKLALPADRPVLLFLGSGFERKGLRFALQALRHLPDALLLVAGRDKPGLYLRLAQKLGVADQVRFMGFTSNAGLLLAGSDALLLPTIYDPCANSCLEALFLGVPVVTTAANGAKEFIASDVNGVVVSEPADDKILALSCEKALSLTSGWQAQLPAKDHWITQTINLLKSTA